MRIGVICEGTTDFAVFEELIWALDRSADVVLLQPDLSVIHPTSGWQAVRKFLRESAGLLGLSSLDALVVHVDGSIALDPELADDLGGRAQMERAVDLSSLCGHVRGWVGPEPGIPVLVGIPRWATESWLLALSTQLKRVEQFADPASELADRGILPRKDGRVVKRAARYRELCRGFGALVADARRLSRTPELDRFVQKVRDFHRSR